MKRFLISCLVSIMTLVPLSPLPAQTLVQGATLTGISIQQPAVLPTWVFEQAAANPSCTGNSCVITVAALTSGSHLVCGMADTVNADNHITSCSGGGTWSLCATQSCKVLNASLVPIDIAYNLSAVGGVTSVTVNIATSSSAWFAVLFEADCTANCFTPALDTIASSNTSSTGCATCNLSGFTSPTTGSLGVTLLSSDHGLSSPTAP